MLRTGMAVLTLLVALAFSGEAQTGEPPQQLVAAYLQVQAALANDTLEGVAPAARTIGEAAGKLGAAGQPAAKAAKELEAAKDLKAARAAFAPLSEAAIAIVKTSPDSHEVKLAYCPMAKASWLQKDDKIRNPYYGSSMLSCGEFRPLDK